MVLENFRPPELCFDTRAGVSVQSNYRLGLMTDEYRKLKVYGHSGFWGTVVLYIPDLNASVSVYVLQKDKRALRREIMDMIIGILIE